jgi:hypothetical protein
MTITIGGALQKLYDHPPNFFQIPHSLSVGCENCVRAKTLYSRVFETTLTPIKIVVSQQKATQHLHFSKKFAFLAQMQSGKTITCDKLSLVANVMRR